MLPRLKRSEGSREVYRSELRRSVAIWGRWLLVAMVIYLAVTVVVIYRDLGTRLF